MQKIYTYGQTQNVLVKLDNHTFDTDINGEQMTINAGIFVEIVPPAALQKIVVTGESIPAVYW